MTALGIHQNVDADESTPFFLREMRKRSFGAASALDKGLATFLGRPPHLTRHYCAYQLPLDLSDTQLMMDGDDLTRALGRLDSKGWNTDSEIYSATLNRAIMLLNIIREEVLEISLGHSFNSLELRIASV